MPVEQTEAGFRFELPGQADLNHIDGVGPIYLLAHLQMPQLADRPVLDLRDAEIAVRLRRGRPLLGGRSLIVVDR